LQALEVNFELFSLDSACAWPAKNFLSAERVTMMPSASKQSVAERVYWSGALTQGMSLGLGGDLLEALKACHILTVNLDGVELLDVSCLVILCVVKRQSNEKGKVLLLEGLENPAVVPVIHTYHSNVNRLCWTYCGGSCLFD
jgi:ABC-type transporter Mla MlaB component